MTALIIFIVAALLLLVFTFMRRKSPAMFRKIEAYERLNRAIGLAVEGGTRLHVSIGRGNLFTSRGGSALAGLAMLRRLSERTSLSDQPPIVTMCEEAPGLIRTFERMGVTFSRTPEGLLDLRLFGGVKNKRTVFAGASTGQQLLYGVDEQVRRYEDQGLVRKHEWWEMLSLVLDDEGRCRGITALDLKGNSVEAFAADAVVLATGGLGLIFGKSTNSANSTGAAASRAYQQGAWFMNGEFIQYHPTGMIGDDKLRLMSEASRGEGARIWTPRQPGDARDPKSIPEAERFYFLEEWYPAFGNTVPRDVASRAIWKVVKHLGLGVRGEDRVYLDLTHLDRDFVRRRLGSNTLGFHADAQREIQVVSAWGDRWRRCGLGVLRRLR